MIHARIDYDRIQDPALSDPSLLSEGSTPIAEDEPVFLIRGRDVCAFAALAAWAEELEVQSSDNEGRVPASVCEVADHVRAWSLVMRRYQREHGAKIPDAPREVLRPSP